MVSVDMKLWGAPVASTTSAPASRARSTPAAVSHGLFARMIVASVRPSATHARSSAAEPNMPDSFGSFCEKGGQV